MSDKINCSAIKVASFFIAGAKDDVISLSDIKSCYNKISIANKKYTQLAFSNHYSFCNGLICWFKSGAVSIQLKQEVLTWMNINLKK